ncbi:hypothetical protein G6549_13855 [Bacillus sp. MM2020_1]|nr:hypothetical protein [Bacillus sp. MM2020_1]
MKRFDFSKLRLSLHAFDRINQRVKPISDFDVAERFAKNEIEESNVTLPETLENGSEKVIFICKDKKFIVIDNEIVTVIPL